MSDKTKTSTGLDSTGDYSTGYYSTGNYSTGKQSTGHWSTGHRSTGNSSTGDHSTGHCSTGEYSTGDCSTGDYSTGTRSTGYHSTGDYSTGDWSISNYSTGHFSTIDYSGFGAFDKPCTPEEWDSADKPEFIYFSLTEWVDAERMTDDEKGKNPSYKTTGGFIRVKKSQDAWREAWNEATEEDKELLFKLPNFDAEVFKKISGIDVREYANARQELIARVKELRELLENLESALAVQETKLSGMLTKSEEIKQLIKTLESQV